MKFTTHFELHSQTTRLFEGTTQGLRHPSHGRGSHPPRPPVPRKLGPDRVGRRLFSLQLRGKPRISNLSFSRFIRHYWGNPCWFLFLALLICLSSGGIPT